MEYYRTGAPPSSWPDCGFDDSDAAEWDEDPGDEGDGTNVDGGDGWPDEGEQNGSGDIGVIEQMAGDETAHTSGVAPVEEEVAPTTVRGISGRKCGKNGWRTKRVQACRDTSPPLGALWLVRCRE